MQNIFLPSKIEILKGKNDNEGQLIVEPLFHGYGITLGNALRRVLLSSLPGAAIVTAKIKGADHEFQTVKGVLEDVLEIVLNLKLVHFKMHSEEPIKLTLKKKGQGEVTAADFEKNSQCEVVNPDQKICSLTDKASEFEIEVTVTQGIGFDPKENRDKKDKEVGVIEIDSIFTPVRNVGYEVENTRVGQITNYDRLVLTVETDGSLTPQQAIKDSIAILQNHFTAINDSLQS